MSERSERSERLGARSGVGWCITALASLGFMARFLRHDLCSFVQDEPLLLAAAREQPLNHHWLSMSPIAGTQGVHYGPVFFVIERLVVWAFGPRPEVMIFVECAVLTAAHVGLAYGIARAFDGGWWIFGLCAGILAASPCQFFYARIAWDNPLVSACVACAVLLLTQNRLSVRRCLVLGLVLGAALGTHLMVMSFVCAVFLVLAWEGRNELGATVYKLAVSAFAIGVVNSSYLLYLARQPALAPTAHHRFAWRSAFDFFLDAASTATATRASYFFDTDWPVFLNWLGPQAALLPGKGSALILSSLALLGLVLSVAMGRSVQKRLALLAITTWISHAVLCAWRHLDPHPHYQQPSYWIIPVGLAALLVHARKLARVFPLVLNTGLVLFIVAQFAFIERWMAYIDGHGGTRGVHYSVPLGMQENLVRRACATAASTVAFDNKTLLFPASLRYLASIEPRCADKEIEFCSDPCQPGSRDRSVFRIEYSGAHARLH